MSVTVTPATESQPPVPPAAEGPRRSFLVGDQETDLAAGRAAGLAVHHFRSDDLLAFLREVALTG